MAFCSKCGTQIADEAAFCPACGQQTGAAAVPPISTQASTQASGFNQQQAGIPPTQPPTQPPIASAIPVDAERDIQDNKGIAIVGYILFFVPLLTGNYKTSPFAKFHANQTLILTICSAALYVARYIIDAVLLAISRTAYSFFGVYEIIALILSIVSLAPLVFIIIGIVNAAGGKMEKLPLIGNFFTILK
ncbi:MAG: zinc-ribbon domain-containing protein [Coriobacteriales bacterium]|nr:zinc-ribbon domain-containing protein [Coriobacteriales bacterium]